MTIKDTYLETLLPRFREERVKAFLTLATTLISVSIFGFFAINPTLTTIAQLKKQLSDSQYVDQKLVQKIANVSALQQSYAQLQDSLSTIMDAVPINPDIPLFAAQVQAIAQTAHTPLLRIQTLPVEITPDVPVNGYLSYTFSLDVQGSESSLSNFINLLQSFNRVITVDEITISASVNSSNLLDANIKGKAYFKKA